MNPEAGRLDGQKFPQMTRWATIAGDWMISVSLATVMAGQIFFSAARFYLGIEHPAWLFWGLLAAGVMLGILRAMPTFKATRADMAMLAFVSVLAVSFMVSGTGSPQRAIYFIAAFMLLPYLAGRLLDETGISRFIVAMSCIAFLAFPLIGIGLLSMPESELQMDRISTLFSDHAGVSPIPHASTVLGLLLVLLTSFLSFSGSNRGAGQQILLVAFMCCVVWLLMFVGLRGAVLVALLVSATSLAFAHSPAKRRIALLFILFSAVTVSWMTMSGERKAHFGQASSIQKDANPLQRHGSPLQRHARSNCVVYGDSVATRVLLFDSAFKLFLDSPWLGVGAGNYGIRGYCDFDESFMSPHSTLLQALSELGLTGALVYLTLVGLTAYGLLQIALRDAGQRQRLALMLAAVWSFFFLQDQLSGNYFTGYHFFAATGLISGLVVAKNIHRNLSGSHDDR